MKKKGFTLIELLAVIIILAVIALIATPVVLNIVEKVRIKAAESSAKGYAKAVEYEIINDTMFKGVNLDGEYDVVDNTIAVKYQGTGPSEGFFRLSKNIVEYGEFCINGYPIKYENSIGKYAPGEIDCGGNNELIFIPPEGELASELCEGKVNYDDVTNINIEKAEDLACISYLSNVKSKTFEGKTLSLIADIDFNDDNSYRDKNNKQIYKDMNGNGVEEDIKIEFTTSKGFKPIGPNSSKPFKGKFEGYAFTLSNLYINRPSENNVGLFGYINSATIIGLNINNINVSGKENVGGVVGSFYSGTINEVALHNGNIIGSAKYVGGIIGINNTNGNKIISVLVNANVTGTYLVGGIGGGGPNTPQINAVVESGTITKTDTSSDTASEIGKIGFWNSTGYTSNLVQSTLANSKKDGVSYKLDKQVMGLYDHALDTYIGGDNDSSGYYLDYENEESTKIVVKSVEKEPFKFSLKGEGTESNPYIISNIKDWREATLKVKGGYYFKITNDLDFEDEKFYMLGTVNNPFDGILDGNDKTIKNVNISGYNSGIIGYLNAGTIKNLNIENSTSTAALNYAGMLVGYNNGGTIIGINVNDIETKGNNHIGGLVGYNKSGSITGININDINVSGKENVGGVVGSFYSGTINEVALHNGNIIGSAKYVGGIIGINNTNGNKIISVLVNANVTGTYLVGGIGGGGPNTPQINAVVESGTITKTDTSSDTASEIGKIGFWNSTGYTSNLVQSTLANSKKDGVSYKLDKQVMGLYDHALDTYIGGDNDSSGYYLDYENEESTKIVVKSVEKEPFKFSLKGEGTESNPYIISNIKDWREATLKVKGGYYFKITNDLDFEDEKFYMLGTVNNPFDGILDGNDKTIKNVNISGYNSGIIGYLNAGTIKNLNIENSTSTAALNYAGMLVGYNNGGTIIGINVNDIETKGNNHIGGLVGYNKSGSITGININDINVSGKENVGGVVGSFYSGTINEVALHNGNIIGSAKYVGGIIGINNSNGNKISNVLVNANVTGTSNVGGIGGGGPNTPEINAVVESGTITKTDTSSDTASEIGKIGYWNSTGYTSNLVQSTLANSNKDGKSYTLLLPITVIDTDGTEIDSLSYYDSKKTLDTVIGGDNDNSGYYLDYNSTGDKIIVVPIGGSSGNTNPSNPSNPSIEIDHNYTMTSIVGTTDTEAPTCELYYVVPVSNGIRASFSCTDNSGAPTVRSLFDSTTEKSAATFDTIGTLKSGSVTGTTKTVISTWNVNNPISQPTKGTCYYFRYGGQDAEGNFSTYVTNICYTGFSN